MFCIRHNKIGSNIIYVKCKKKKTTFKQNTNSIQTK